MQTEPITLGSNFQAALIRQYVNPNPSSVIASTNAESAFDVFPTIAANSLQVGTVIDYQCYGIYGTALVAPTINCRARLGGLGGTLLFATGAMGSLVGSLSNIGWLSWGRLVVRAIGAAGSMEVQGFTSWALGLLGTQGVHLVNSGVVTGLNTTIDQSLVMTIQFNTSSASNFAQIRSLTYDIWNPLT